MADISYLRQLVNRYVANKATEDELKAFFYLLDEGKLDNVIAECLDAQQQDELYADRANRRTTGADKVRRFTLNISMVTTAAAVLLLLLGAVFLNKYPGTLEDWLNPVTYSLVSTGRNQLKAVTLSDGSTVMLNSNTTLKYPSRFKSERAVELLEGEAYFEIKHNDNKIFSVTAKNIKTEVLGTAFNIQSFNYVNSVKVTVSKGRVAVQSKLPDSSRSEQIILNPDEQADVLRSSGAISKNKVKSADVLNWRQGGLFFNNESFRDVAVILEQKYDVKIRFLTPEIADYRFTAGFKASENLDDILEALSLANDLKYEVKNDIITFKTP